MSTSSLRRATPGIAKRWVLLDSLAAGRIKPVVAERIPLVEAVRAHELLERGGYAGKEVLVTSA